ncbi:hypothetical protein ACTHT5_11450, partial [Neisseria sp. P0022.S002]|uniref:hypothetical protein n=1 Tax=Neisseria sp. P0022.S002 TaxID=3436827 RepID=UPI003F813328
MVGGVPCSCASAFGRAILLLVGVLLVGWVGGGGWVWVWVVVCVGGGVLWGGVVCWGGVLCGVRAEVCIGVLAFFGLVGCVGVGGGFGVGLFVVVVVVGFGVVGVLCGGVWWCLWVVLGWGFVGLLSVGVGGG